MKGVAAPFSADNVEKENVLTRKGVESLRDERGWVLEAVLVVVVARNEGGARVRERWMRRAISGGAGHGVGYGGRTEV